MAKTERNREIVQMRSEGKTLKAVGEHFGITTERVRQILRQEERREKRKHGSLCHHPQQNGI